MTTQKLAVAAAPADSDYGRDKWTQLCDRSILEPQLPWEAKCIEAPESAYVAPHAVGERLEKGTFEVLLNVTYHGLPPSDGSFWYVRTEGRIYKVKPGTFEILEDMTYDAKRLNRYK